MQAEPRRQPSAHPLGDRHAEPDPGFLWRVARVLGLAVLVGLGVLLLLHGIHAVLLAFAGVLIAVLLRAPSNWLAEHTPLTPDWALAGVVAAILAVLALVGWLVVPSLVQQAGQFVSQMSQLSGTVQQWLQGLGGERLDLSLSQILPSAQALAGKIPNALTATFGTLAGVVLVVFIGLYGAARPAVYRDGFVRLFPARRRQRARDVLDEAGDVLKRFLVGQLVSMAAVGLLSYIGLLALGVPLALGLAVLTGLLEFIPYLGPIFATVPAVLVGIAQGPSTALSVLLLYAGVQLAESYLITPLVQQRAVYLPPALIILVQSLMGILFGLMGVILATPLAAVGLVLVRRLYLEGALGDTAARSS